MDIKLVQSDVGGVLLRIGDPTPPSFQSDFIKALAFAFSLALFFLSLFAPGVLPSFTVPSYVYACYLFVLGYTLYMYGLI